MRWFEEVIDRGDGFVIRTSDGKQYSLELFHVADELRRWYTVADRRRVVVGAVILFFLIRSDVARRPSGRVPRGRSRL